MSFGPSPIEKEAQQYRKDFGAALPGYVNQGQNWMQQGMGQLNSVNSDIRNYISGIGKDPTSTDLQNYLSDVMSGKLKGPTGQAFLAEPMMKGNQISQMFGSDLGGLALQQKNMQTVADKLSSTTQNPFAQLSKQAMEDAAFQNAQGRSQLQSQLAAQGLDASSGTGAAALAALQFNTNKSVADATRQNAVQGAQFQQQGLGMAGQLYGQMGQLDLQRATTGAQLGLQDAQRQDAVSLANAQMQTQASLQNAGMQNDLMKAGLQGQLAMQQFKGQQEAALYGMLSGNANSLLGAGSDMFKTGFTGQANYMNMMNQSAAQSAAGRGAMIGGITQGIFGLAGAALGGPIGGSIGSWLGSKFGGGTFGAKPTAAMNNGTVSGWTFGQMADPSLQFGTAPESGPVPAAGGWSMMGPEVGPVPPVGLGGYNYNYGTTYGAKLPNSFGTFNPTLPGSDALREGFGVTNYWASNGYKPITFTPQFRPSMPQTYVYRGI